MFAVVIQNVSSNNNNNSNNNKQICIALYGPNFGGVGATQRVNEQRKKRKPYFLFFI